MKKKSVIARVGVMAAALTLATTSLMSGTLAKYTTTVNGVATAIVAQWSPSVLVDDEKKGQTFTIKLNDYVNGYQGDTVAHDTENDDDYYLAPGVKGTIPITIDMGAELGVDTVYQVEIAAHDGTGEGDVDATNMAMRIPGHMKFTCSVGSYNNSVTVGSAPATVVKGVIANKYKMGDTSFGVSTPGYATVDIGFEWPFETVESSGGESEGNSNDTFYITDENPEAKNIELDIIITVWQASSEEAYNSSNSGILDI